MTAKARLRQSEIDRALKAALAAPAARVILDHRRERIEIIVGDAAHSAVESNPWDDDDA